MEFTVPHYWPQHWLSTLYTEPFLSPGVSNGAMLWSVSSCPGDFHPDPVYGAACFHPFYSITQMGGPTNPVIDCKLEPGQTYYMNLLPTESPQGTPVESMNWSCSGGSACGRRVTPSYDEL